MKKMAILNSGKKIDMNGYVLFLEVSQGFHHQFARTYL